MPSLDMIDIPVQRWTIYGRDENGRQFEMGATSVEQAVQVLKQAGRETDNLDVRAVAHGNYAGQEYGITLDQSGKATIVGPKGEVIFKEEKSMSKYKVLAEAIASGKLKKVEMPTERINYRRLTVDEIKQHLIEEFGKAKDAAAIKAKEATKGWGDAEIAKEIEWVKALDLCEALGVEALGHDDLNNSQNPYFDSAQGQMLDRARAEKELAKHGVKKGTPEYQQFEKQFGGKPQIDAQELLSYLGY